MSGFLDGAVTALAGARYLSHTRRATRAAFDQPAERDTLAEHVDPLRDSLSQWQGYAQALERENAELRELLRSLGAGPW
jgi:hypothetical protein